MTPPPQSSSGLPRMALETPSPGHSSGWLFNTCLPQVHGGSKLCWVRTLRTAGDEEVGKAKEGVLLLVYTTVPLLWWLPESVQ